MPSDFNSTPDITLLKLLPSPHNVPPVIDPATETVAKVQIPVALILFASRVPSVPTPVAKSANLVASEIAILLF